MNQALVSDVYKLNSTTSTSMPEDSPLEKILWTLVREPSLRSIFLVDSKQQFVGIITKMKLMHWAHIQLTGKKEILNLPIAEFFKIIDARKGRDVVSYGKDAYVKETDTLDAALGKMLYYEEDVIPILDSNSRIKGDLSFSEILWWVLAHGKGTTAK